MKSVIIVEDEAIIALLHKKILLRHGYNVITLASSKNEIIEKINKAIPDIIFMDIAMEEKTSGIDACFLIKEKYPDVKIFFVSAYPKYFFKNELRKIKYDGYIDKMAFERKIKSISKSGKDK